MKAKIGAIILLTLFTLGAGKQTIEWMNDYVKQESKRLDGKYGTSVIHAASQTFLLVVTNEVELGLRSDGVVVWRKAHP